MAWVPRVRRKTSESETLCCPMDCSPPGSSVHGNLQAGILEWVALPSSRAISLTQGLNPHLLHCRQILYQLSPHVRGQSLGKLLWDAASFPPYESQDNLTSVGKDSTPGLVGAPGPPCAQPRSELLPGPVESEPGFSCFICGEAQSLDTGRQNQV